MKMLLSIFIIYIFSFSLNAKSLEKISLQLQWKDQFQFAGYYMAKEKGFYKDAGLDVDIKKYFKGVNTTDEVLSGKSDFGIGRSTLLIDKSKGKEIVLLNAIFQTSPLVLFTLKSSNIDKIEDFKNKKIMIDKKQSVTVAIRAMLNSKQVMFDDMRIFKRTYNINDLISKRVDIMPGYISDKGYALEKQGIDFQAYDPKDYGFDFYEDILFTSDSYMRQNPKRVEAFRKASLKGWEYAFHNIEETVALILKKYNIQNKTKGAYIYEANALKQRAYFNNIPLGNIDINKIKRIYASYNVLGFMEKHIENIDDLVYQPTKSYGMFTKQQKEYLKNKDAIKICIDPNWLPFEKIDENGKHIGISADYFQNFEKHLGTKFHLVKTKNWTQTLEFAKLRKCDLITLGNETPSRKEYLAFTEPYLKIPFVMVTKNEVSFIDDLHTVKGEKIGVVKNSALMKKNTLN